MNWDAIGAIAELTAAIGVIVTLIYLAAQIRHSAEETKEQSTQALVLTNFESTLVMVRDEKLAELLLRGIHGQELTELEQLRYNGYFFSYYNQVDYAYEKYRKGKLDKAAWDRIAKEIPAYIGAPGGQRWWAKDKSRFSPEFAKYVETVVLDTGAPSEIPSVPNLTNDGDAAEMSK